MHFKHNLAKEKKKGLKLENYRKTEMIENCNYKFLQR